MNRDAEIGIELGCQPGRPACRSGREKEGVFFVYKNIGETPLGCLERLRSRQIAANAPAPDGYDWKSAPMTYAGRLDPMAEGIMLILVGDKCKEKEKYLGLDKEYEVEIVFGIGTDTHDTLGLVELNPNHEIRNSRSETSRYSDSRFISDKYVGKFSQPYPPFSSKTVGGRYLHELARTGELPDRMPTKEVTIHSLELIQDLTSKIDAGKLKTLILDNISLVKGHFRQKEVIARWNEVFAAAGLVEFTAIKIRVKCSSGTYMRSLADRIGKDAGTGAFALSIKRTRLGDQYIL